MSTLDVQVLPENELDNMEKYNEEYKVFTKENPKFSINEFFRDSG